jgi:hypothetical protein
VLVFLSAAVAAAEPCGCYDGYDLGSRQAIAVAAVQAYQDAIEDWNGFGAPMAFEDNRQQFQNERIKPAVNGAVYPESNRAGGRTDELCDIQNTAPTACLHEAIQQHEIVHATACRNASFARFMGEGGLAAYAREEIAAYQAELGWVRRQLDRLRRQCLFVLNFESSVLPNPFEIAKSNAKAKVELRLNEGGLLEGESQLDYKTEDAGPPKVTPDVLTQLNRCKIPPYPTWEGAGRVAIQAPSGFVVRRPAAQSLAIELLVAVDESRETRTFKGSRKCLAGIKPPDEEGSFWTSAFYAANPSEWIDGRMAVRVREWSVALPPAAPPFATRRLPASNDGGGRFAMEPLADTRLELHLERGEP